MPEVTSLFKLADVSVRLLKLDPQAEDIRQYISGKVHELMRRDFITHSGDAREMVDALVSASDGL